jgi:hypothetical protein
MKDDSNAEKKTGKSKKEVWDPTKDPIQEGEELVYDSSAY